MQASAVAIESLRAFNFAMVTTIQVARGLQGASLEGIAQCMAEIGDVSFCSSILVPPTEAPSMLTHIQQFTVSGAFQAPDRLRAVMEQDGPWGTRQEGIMIGEVWTRTNDGAWRLGAPGPGPLHPRLLAEALHELSGILENPAMSEQSGHQVISGGAEIVGDAATDSVLASLVAGPFFGALDPGLPVRARLSLTLDGATGRLLELAADTRVTLPPEAPPGAPFPSLPTEQMITTSLTLSDFDDPSIQIDRPR